MNAAAVTHTAGAHLHASSMQGGKSRWATCCSTITSPRPRQQLVKAITAHAQRGGAQDSIPDFALQRRRLAWISPAKLGYMIAGNRTTGQPFERLGIQRQEPDHQPGHRPSACAHAVSYHRARGLSCYNRTPLPTLNGIACKDHQQQHLLGQRMEPSSTACAASTCRCTRSARLSTAKPYGFLSRKTTAAIRPIDLRFVLKVATPRTRPLSGWLHAGEFAGSLPASICLRVARSRMDFSRAARRREWKASAALHCPIASRQRGLSGGHRHRTWTMASARRRRCSC